MTSSSQRTSDRQLRMGDAVAALIRVPQQRFLMQLRNDRPDIWYPATWGCFGGALEPGESPLEALRRELDEELELKLRQAVPISRFEFDLRDSGLGVYFRAYYLVELTQTELDGLVLHEGERMAALSYEELDRGKPMTPYDAFALHLFYRRSAGELVG